MRWRDVLRAIWQRKSAAVGALIITGTLLLSLLAPYIALRDPTDQALSLRTTPPNREYWLGTDALGRDILSRIVWGSRISLLVATLAVAIGALGGTLVGGSSGYLGGAADQLLMRIVDIMMAFPTILLAIAIVAVMGRGVGNLAAAIGIANVPQFARVVRGEILRVKLMDYVEAARALGVSSFGIVWRHILPNIWSALIVLTSLRVSVAILAESSLSFLGLSVPPPAPSWGTMVAEGQKFLILAPWISIVPGTVIVVIVLALNLLGDGVRDALDPRLRGEGR